MEERNLTQRQLGKELNIAASTLNGYVNDNREPDFQTLLCFARYFQVSTDYLVNEAKLLVKHCQDAAAPAPRKQ